MWKHMMENFEAELFVWSGDNAYGADGDDQQLKRESYNKVREDKYYGTDGPLGMKIPVTGTWDDHDMGLNNGGNHFGCRKESQAEFVEHFSVPEEDPRHPAQGENQREGVYSANMFRVPESSRSGFHVVNLDARYHRSPTIVGKFGACEGETDFLGEEQWRWLEEELEKKSEVLVVTSGIQVLPPINMGDEARVKEMHCAFDEEGGSFEESITAVGETTDWRGGIASPHLENWGEIPQARTRLLKLVQRYGNAGKHKTAVFLSGNMHFGEIMAKRMPEDPVSGPERMFYELTASGVEYNRKVEHPNSSRVRLRSADKRGNNFYDRECNFPYYYKGDKFTDCIYDKAPPGESAWEEGKSWCSLIKDLDDNNDKWGYCLEESLELVPREKQYTDGKTCSSSYHHVCGLEAVYGGIEVDWNTRELQLSVFKKDRKENVTLASRIYITLGDEMPSLSPSFAPSLNSTLAQTNSTGRPIGTGSTSHEIPSLSSSFAPSLGSTLAQTNSTGRPIGTGSTSHEMSSLSPSFAPSLGSPLAQTNSTGRPIGTVSTSHEMSSLSPSFAPSLGGPLAQTNSTERPIGTGSASPIVFANQMKQKTFISVVYYVIAFSFFSGILLVIYLMMPGSTE